MPRNAANNRSDHSDRSLAANDAGPHAASLAAAPDWRHANAVQLAAGLRAIRQQTLQVFDAYVAAGALHVPYKEEFTHHYGSWAT